jgi:hypothetical protein
MKFLDSHWERVRFSITPGNLRIGLVILSIAAMVLGGAADESWS